MCWKLPIRTPSLNSPTTSIKLINQVNQSNSIKFTYAQEKDGTTPFLDTFIVRKSDATVKLLVYRKPNAHRPLSSHHPLHQKLDVIRTLFDRKNNIVTEEEDKIQEEQKIKDALKT